MTKKTNDGSAMKCNVPVDPETGMVALISCGCWCLDFDLQREDASLSIWWICFLEWIHELAYPFDCNGAWWRVAA